MKLRQMVAMAFVLTGAGLFAATAQAQPSEKFRSLDKNGDGVLTKDEVSHLRGYAKAFDEADDNHDGKLSPDEFVKAESIYSRQQVGGYVGDTELTTKVKAALVSQMKSMEVHVETDNGRVLLSGWVANESERQKAIQIASGVQGVREVKDGMTVR
jgi:Ca2+-binding EF-hand superfamily protein